MSLAIQFKDTWWNRLRVEKNITYKDLATYMECSISHVGGIFSGQKIPERDDLYNLCDLFDVDYAEGEQRFLDDHLKWVSEKKAKARAITNTNEKKKTSVKKKSKRVHSDKKMTAVETDNTVCDTPTEETHTVDVLEVLYGKVGYENFTQILNAVKSGETDILKLCYGKVSYDEYKVIEEELKNV